MFDHMNFQVSDLKKSRAFYRAALAPLGLKAESSRTYVLFKDSNMQLGIIGGRASKHLHLAFKAHSQKEVDKFYKAAIKNGGIDNCAISSTGTTQFHLSGTTS